MIYVKLKVGYFRKKYLVDSFMIYFYENMDVNLWRSVLGLVFFDVKFYGRNIWFGSGGVVGMVIFECFGKEFLDVVRWTSVEKWFTGIKFVVCKDIFGNLRCWICGWDSSKIFDFTVCSVKGCIYGILWKKFMRNW